MKRAWLVYYASEWSVSFSVAPVRIAYRRGYHVRVVFDCGERRWVYPHDLFNDSIAAHAAAGRRRCGF